MTIAVGSKAPSFTLPSNKGDIDLKKEIAKGPVLLVFYPGDDTPVCTKQLCNYRDNLDMFADIGVNVVAINPQSIDSHEAFAEKYDLPFPVVSDDGGKVCREYGAMSFLGTAKRALVLVGKDGTVKWSTSNFPIFHQSADDIRQAIADIDLGQQPV
jgi:peroxiredoxin